MSLYIPNSASYINTVWSPPATQDMTFMAWILFPGAAATYRVVVDIAHAGTPSTTNDQAMISTAADGHTIGFGTESTNNLTSYALSYNTWYHVCQSVRNLSTTNHFIKGYLNGQQLIYVNNTTSTFAVPTGITLGNWIAEGGVIPLYGNLRDFRMWNHELSAAEVYQEYQSGVVVKNAGLIVNSYFDTNIYMDDSGKGHLWTATGSPVLGQGSLRKAYPAQKRSFII